MPPLVSVIIVCYNQGHYLEASIKSVLAQDHPHVDILVVDDGSTDRTRAICRQHAGVRYMYQSNQGPSAARNTGIQNSRGELILFLDADDWLLPGALLMNVRSLQQHPEAAFVSGAHLAVNERDGVHRQIHKPLLLPPYCQLLEANYIGMLGTVLVQRRVFDECRFDPSLRYCEDYDLYLSIARRHPVIHHAEPVAVYRFHESNTSRNFIRMLESALAVLEKQKMFLSTPLEEHCFQRGKERWTVYYTERMYDRLITATSLKELKTRRADVQLLKSKAPALYQKFRKTRIRLFIKLVLPFFVVKRIKNIFYSSRTPS